MPEIRLVKKYPHIKDEDVTSIFQEGYIKGFENGRKSAIPIEWIRKQIEKALSVDSVDLFYVGNLKHLIKEWEKENENRKGEEE